MVVAAGRFFGIAIAPQIRGNDREFLGQARRNLVPGKMRKGIAVHQQHRRAPPPMHGDDTRAGSLDLRAGEALEHAILGSAAGYVSPTDGSKPEAPAGADQCVRTMKSV